MVEVAAKAGVDIRPIDISIAHRIPTRRGSGPRPIIVKFIRRKHKIQLMKNKRNLTGKGEEYVVEDLTPLRAKLLRIAKESANVINAFAREGRIVAYVRGKDRPVTVESPDDLWKVGLSSIDHKALGLTKFLLDASV